MSDDEWRRAKEEGQEFKGIGRRLIDNRHKRTHERTANGGFESFEEEDEEYEGEGDEVDLDERGELQVENSQQSGSLDGNSPSSAGNDDGGYAPSSFQGVGMSSGRGDMGQNVMMAAPSQLIGVQRGYVG